MVSYEVVDKSIFLQSWITENLASFKLLYPNENEEKIRKILRDIAQEQCVDMPAMIHNDYQDDTTINCSLLSVANWIDKNKPICAGNGTFFKNHNHVTSPIQHVIDNRISARKSYQHIRDGFDDNSYEYRYNDMMQAEAKIKINSIYGSFGTTTFQLYNRYTASATTGTAQALISATEQGIEAFLSNNVLFRSLGECVRYITNILTKDIYTDEILMSVKQIQNPDVVFKLLKSRFECWLDDYTNIIMGILHNASVSDLTKIYYKNNLYALMDNDIMNKTLCKIFHNTTEFKNPNEVPENIQRDLEMIWLYCDELVFYNHPYEETIKRLKECTRESVVLIDTDSNIVNIEPWIDYLKETVWKQSNSSMDNENLIFTSVNTIAFLVTQMIKNLLDNFTSRRNVLDRFKHRINMKNEFYFTRMVLAKVKKRYMSAIALKEGRLLSPKKIDIKGHDFKKAGVNQDIHDEIVYIAKNYILEPEEIDIGMVLRELDNLENDIRESLSRGERKYLLRQNCKVEKAYKNPMSQGAVKGPLLWNILYPNNEILIPDKLDMLIIKIRSEQDLEVIRDKFPREYSILKNDVFHGPIKEFHSDLTYLALPNNGDPVPEFIRPFIDIDKIISRNIGTFLPVQEALGMVSGIGKQGLSYFTNVINV